MAKGKTGRKCGKKENFAAVSKSKTEKLLVNLLQNKSSSDA